MQKIRVHCELILSYLFPKPTQVEGSCYARGEPGHCIQLDKTQVRSFEFYCDINTYCASFLDKSSACTFVCKIIEWFENSSQAHHMIFYNFMHQASVLVGKRSLCYQKPKITIRAAIYVNKAKRTWLRWKVKVNGESTKLKWEKGSNAYPLVAVCVCALVCVFVWVMWMPKQQRWNEIQRLQCIFHDKNC